MKTEALLVTALVLTGCSGRSHETGSLSPGMLASMDWRAVVEKARASEVGFAMWAGDDIRNRLFRGEIAQRIERMYGITLRIVPLSDTAEAVNKLLNEKSAGKASGGSIDFIWINGENFRTARQGGLLWGPFSGFLPSSRLYDGTATARDFGTPVEGFEAPWQRSQFVMAYDSARVPQPPASIPALEKWIREHPGRFTYTAPPDFTGSAFLRHLLIHQGHRNPAFWTGFDEKLYSEASERTLRFLNEIKPHLWRRGETFPSTPGELNRLFANREVDFAMSYSPAFASVLISRGEFPASARTFVFEDGTLTNYTYLAIPFNASNPGGALVVINELMSFDTLLQLGRRLDHLMPYPPAVLTPAQLDAVKALRPGPATLPAEFLDQHAFPEPDSAYLSRLEKDWLAKVLRQ